MFRKVALLALLLSLGLGGIASADPLVVGVNDGFGPVNQVRFGMSRYGFRMEMRALEEPAAVMYVNPGIPQAFPDTDKKTGAPIWVLPYQDAPLLFKRLVIIGVGSQWPWQDSNWVDTLATSLRLSGELGSGPINAEGLAEAQVEKFVSYAYCQAATLLVELEVPDGDCKTRRIWAWVDIPVSLIATNGSGQDLALWSVAPDGLIYSASDECKAVVRNMK